MLNKLKGSFREMAEAAMKRWPTTAPGREASRQASRQSNNIPEEQPIAERVLSRESARKQSDNREVEELPIEAAPPDKVRALS